MNSPRITVVIPAYNCERWIAETLRSIQEQTFSSWECVVVDDGSPDRCAQLVSDIAMADHRIRLVRQANGGISLARNRGIAEGDSQAEFLNFLDADDVLEPRAFAVLVEAAEANPARVGVQSLGDFIDENGKPFDTGAFAKLGRSRMDGSSGRMEAWPLDRPSTLATVASASTAFPLGMSILRRREVIEAGCFDPLIRHAEDWDLLMRLCRRGDLHFLNQVLIGYRRHSANSGAKSDIPEWCRRAFWKNYHAPGLSPEHRELFRNIYRARQRNILDVRRNQMSQAMKKGRIFKATAEASRLPFITYRRMRGSPSLGWL